MNRSLIIFFHHSDKTLEKINLKEADLFGFLVSETPFIMSTGSVAFKDCREAETSRHGRGQLFAASGEWCLSIFQYKDSNSRDQAHILQPIQP